MAVQGIFLRKLPNFRPGPRLNVGNPLARGLVGAWPLASHDLRNYARNKGLAGIQSDDLDEVLTATGNGITSTGFRGNIVPRLAGSADYFDAGFIDMQNWTSFSASVWVSYDSSGTDEHSIIANFTPGNTGCFRLALEPTDDTIEFLLVEQTNTNRVLTGVGSVTPNVFHHIVAVYDPLGEGNMRLYQNGIRQSGTTAVTGVLDATSTEDNIFIGEATHTANDSLTGSPTNAYLWKERVLTDSEVMSLYRLEWQLYIAQSQIIPVGTIDAVGGRIMSSLANNGGLAGLGGIAGAGGGLAG